MPYSPDADNGTARRWVLRFTHISTDVSIVCQIQPTGNATEAQRDAVFQALLDKVNTLQGITITEAVKLTEYTSTVTPTP